MTRVSDALHKSLMGHWPRGRLKISVMEICTSHLHLGSDFLSKHHLKSKDLYSCRSFCQYFLCRPELFWLWAKNRMFQNLCSIEQDMWNRLCKPCWLTRSAVIYNTLITLSVRNLTSACKYGSVQILYVVSYSNKNCKSNNRDIHTCVYIICYTYTLCVYKCIIYIHTAI